MKKTIMGIQLEDVDAQAAAGRLKELLTEDTLSVCGLIRTGMLLEAEEREEYRDLLNQLSLGIIADTEVLKAVGVTGEARQKEVEENLFLTCLLENLKEDCLSIAVLVDLEAEKQQAAARLKERCPSIKLAGVLSMESFDDVDDAVNHINGMDADVVLAMLPSPVQEEFIFANRGKLNIKCWVGLGKGTAAGKKTEKVPGFLGKLIEKRLFKKKVTQYFQEKE